MSTRAGGKLTVADFGVTLSDTENTLGTTTSTSYTATLTGGTACGIAFVAPPSGAVLIHNSSVCDNDSTAQRSYCTFRVRTGTTIGSGSDVVAAADANAIYNLGTADNCYGRAIHITGLSPGGDYNVQQLFKTSNAANVATFLSKHLIVQPVY